MSKAGSDHHTTSLNPYQGDKDTHLWTNLSHEGADTRSKNYSLAACIKKTKNIVIWIK